MRRKKSLLFPTRGARLRLLSGRRRSFFCRHQPEALAASRRKSPRGAARSARKNQMANQLLRARREGSCTFAWGFHRSAKAHSLEVKFFAVGHRACQSKGREVFWLFVASETKSEEATEDFDVLKPFAAPSAAADFRAWQKSSGYTRGRRCLESTPVYRHTEGRSRRRVQRRTKRDSSPALCEPAPLRSETRFCLPRPCRLNANCTDSCFKPREAKEAEAFALPGDGAGARV